MTTRNFFDEKTASELIAQHFGDDIKALPKGRKNNAPELKALLKKMFKYTKKGLRFSNVAIGKALGRDHSTIHRHRSKIM